MTHVTGSRYTYVLMREGMAGIGPFSEVTHLNGWARNHGLAPGSYTILVVEQPSAARPLQVVGGPAAA